MIYDYTDWCTQVTCAISLFMNMPTSYIYDQNDSPGIKNNAAAMSGDDQTQKYITPVTMTPRSAMPRT